MTLAFDVATSVGGISFGGASTNTFPNAHTPAGTPRGVIAFLVTDEDTDEVTSVTYGGDAMTELAASPMVQTLGAEHGVVHGFFLGTSIPTGTQSLACTVTDAGFVWGALCTVTAAADVEVADSSASEAASGATPATVLDLPNSGGTFSFEWTHVSDEWAIMAAAIREIGGNGDVFISGALWSGNENTGGPSQGAGQTVITEQDLGTSVAGWSYVTSLQSDPVGPAGPGNLGLHGALELSGLVLPVRRHDGGQYREYGVLRPYQNRHRPHTIGRKRVPDV